MKLSRHCFSKDFCYFFKDKCEASPFSTKISDIAVDDAKSGDKNFNNI